MWSAKMWTQDIPENVQKFHKHRGKNIVIWDETLQMFDLDCDRFYKM